MTSYILRRILLIFPTLLGMTAIVFFIMALSPGGIGAALISRESGMNPQQRRAIEQYLNKRYGLNKPPIVQYFRWLGEVSPIGPKETGQGFPKRWTFGLKAPDLGESFVLQRPVGSLIGDALPITLLLNGVSIPIIYFTAITSGMVAARRRGKLVDVASGFTLLGLWSVPTIWAGVLMIGMLANREYVQWFPTNGLHDIQSSAMRFLPSIRYHAFDRGWLLDTLWHLVLPVACLSYGSIAFLSKLQRGSILENISLDYVRTARAKGLDEHTVMYRHVFRNSLIPLITVAAYVLPGMLAGSVVVETIFGIPGMGKLIVDAVFMRDRELILSDTLVAGFVGLAAYLLADICYVLADPRVSYD